MNVGILSWQARKLKEKWAFFFRLSCVAAKQPPHQSHPLAVPPPQRPETMAAANLPQTAPRFSFPITQASASGSLSNKLWHAHELLLLTAGEEVGKSWHWGGGPKLVWASETGSCRLWDHDYWAFGLETGGRAWQGRYDTESKSKAVAVAVKVAATARRVASHATFFFWKMNETWFAKIARAKHTHELYIYIYRNNICIEKEVLLCTPYGMELKFRWGSKRGMVQAARSQLWPIKRSFFFAKRKQWSSRQRDLGMLSIKKK